ncbi:MAG: hypothetical protein HZR80_09740 [Candidatus Heimdallarchaeota archaeon]
MTKSIVIYNSRGGNTKKVAINIAEGLGAELVQYKKMPDLKDYDLVVLGTWVLAGNPSPHWKKKISKLDPEQLKGKNAVMFICAGGPDNPPLGQGPEAGIIKDLVFELMQKALEDKGAKIAKERLAIHGTFRFFRFGLGAMDKGHPNEEELKQAKKFGESLNKYLK